MTHVYSFAIIAAFLYMVLKWYDNPNWKSAAILGFLIGLIALIRPTNILVVIVLALWGVTSFKELWERVVFFVKRFHLVFLMLAMFFLAWLPQMLYWKYVTGYFIYYSYGDKNAHFFWGNPQLTSILFSYRKGWLLYTPIMNFAIIGVFFLIRKKMKDFFVPLFLFVFINIYVQASWWCWWYGGGFSGRTFVDSYALMAIPLATIIHFGFNWKKWTKRLTVILTAVLILFGTFQSIQFMNHIIHFWAMSKEVYWGVFLKVERCHGFYAKLHFLDYLKAREGIYVDAENPYLKKMEKAEKQFERLERDEIKLIMNELRSHDRLFAEIEKKATKRRIPVDSMLYLDALWLFNNNENYMQRFQIKKYEFRIRNNKRLLESIEQKALDRNIPLDSMIRMDARWMYNRDQE